MSRNYCFTKFGEWGLDKVDLSRVTYLCFQEEICPKSQRRHYQGYCQFKLTVRVKSAQSILGIGKSHVEMQKGTNDEARAYCMKAESRVPGAEPIEFGLYCAGQGERTDLKVVLNRPIAEVVENNPEMFVKYHRGLVALRDWKHQTPSNDGEWEIRRVLRADEVPKDSYSLKYEDIYDVGKGSYCRKYCWDYYDYQENAVVIGSPPDFKEIWVRSIYRGLICNLVKVLYVLPKV